METELIASELLEQKEVFTPTISAELEEIVQSFVGFMHDPFFSAHPKIAREFILYGFLAATDQLIMHGLSYYTIKKGEKPKSYNEDNNILVISDPDLDLYLREYHKNIERTLLALGYKRQNRIFVPKAEDSARYEDPEMEGLFTALKHFSGQVKNYPERSIDLPRIKLQGKFLITGRADLTYEIRKRK